MLGPAPAGSRAAAQRRGGRRSAGAAAARAAAVMPRPPGHAAAAAAAAARPDAAAAAAASDAAHANTRAPPAAARRAAAAAALAATLLAAAPPPARADLEAAPSYAVGDDAALFQRYNSDMEELSRYVDPDVAMPPELRDFLALFENGTPRDLKRLEAARERVGFRRGADGRVSLLSDGEEFQVKADMGASGYLLLRDARGYCYYLPPDPSGRVAQIDLSDDVLVAQLFASGLWEETVEPLEALPAPKDGNASSSEPVHLRLSEQQWRSVTSLLAGARELPEEPLEDLEAAEAAAAE